MRQFKFINDIENWLEPLSYDDLWVELEPHALDIPTKDHCDELIEDAGLTKDLAANVIKDMVRVELAERFDLHWDDPVPFMQVH